MVGHEVETVSRQHGVTPRRARGTAARRSPSSGSRSDRGCVSRQGRLLLGRRRRDRRRRRRLGQRPARARGGDRRASADVPAARFASPARRSQTAIARAAFDAGARLRPRRPARHRRRAEPLDRDEPRAAELPAALGRSVPAPAADARRRARRRFATTRSRRPARAATPATSPAATCRSSCSRASSPAASRSSSPPPRPAASTSRAVETVHAHLARRPPKAAPRSS